MSRELSFGLGSRSEAGVPVAMELGLRLGLIAFAAVSLQSVLLLSDFQIAVGNAVAASVGMFLVGCLGGEIARRIVQESVLLELRRAAEQQQTITDGTAGPVNSRASA